jgi:hypothetical protein
MRFTLAIQFTRFVSCPRRPIQRRFHTLLDQALANPLYRIAMHAIGLSDVIIVPTQSEFAFVSLQQNLCMLAFQGRRFARID